jgi:hypothetical protein
VHELPIPLDDDALTFTSADGTDASWTPAPAVVDMAKHIEEGVPRVFGHLGKDVIAGVFSGNAEKLFARAS